MPPNTKPTGDAMLEVNKSLVLSFVEAWNRRDFNRFASLMAPDAVLHVGGGEVPCDPSGTRAIAEKWTMAFPDYRFSLLGVVAEGDRVVLHMPYGGTHRGTIAGVEPTGRSCIVDEIVIFRIAEGKIAEAWEVFDEAGMWRQLGIRR